MVVDWESQEVMELELELEGDYSLLERQEQWEEVPEVLEMCLLHHRWVHQALGALVMEWCV